MTARHALRFASLGYLAVLLVAALVVIAMITTELTDFSFSLF